MQVTPETRKDKRLLAVLPPTPERKRGMLFGGSNQERRDPAWCQASGWLETGGRAPDCGGVVNG